ncbi:PREDICTED: myb-like protein X isoform X3 [Ipomoea nil]|uniref:myb-like protein X isoform X2 n=1 Tax=Ipomoea nil TaxID=35883 RepID=UPI000901F26B|nr:PREDICTED: myb-like protein X isoform X2 [Ipomoea nil]XP_019184107.1 PREDICTED: myb-like protein X isoform X3 [Ipomoea nil]
MSRCFPFPPPGYENKARSEDADLLKEEKRKEKKHKKEKKDKEKGEGKEKREKDRSDGKHREKKDKKDKHKDKDKDKKEKNRDKKRDKDKSKDKDKKSISEEAKAAGQPGTSSTETDKKNEHFKNINSEEKKNNVQLQVQHGQKAIQGSGPDRETEESKFVQELGRRIRDEENGKGIQLAGRFSAEWKRDERIDRVGVKVGSSLAEDKGTNMERSIDNKKMDVQATRNESRFSGNAIVPSIIGASKNKIEGMPRVGVKDSGNFTENKETHVEKSLDNRKMDAHPIRNESNFSGNLAVPNLTGFSKSKVEGMGRPLEENNERKEEKEKTKERGDGKLGSKNKDKNGDKKRHKKDKGQEKEKKKEKKKEKSKEKSEHKGIEKDRLRDINKNEFSAVSSNKAPALSTDTNAGTAFDVNLKKRKLVTNGSLSENETRPVKMPRPASHEPIQNGNKVETLQVSLLTSNRQEGASELKVVNKVQRINGAIHGQPLSVPRPKPLLSTTGSGQIPETSKKPTQADQIAEAFRKPPHTDQIAEVSRKPRANPIAEASKKPPHTDLIIEAAKKAPHPDSKYMSQILTVPKMEEWIESDDNEWLFGRKNPSDRKPGVADSNGVNEELQVWSEARYIESTDVYALPYVIPY